MDYWWSESGLRFECAACGRCCGGSPGVVWTTPAERAKIAKELGIDAMAFREKYMVRLEGKCSLRELENYDCIFLERNSARCKIYKVRPLQCRLFPFWPSLLTDQNGWNYYANFCQGMNQGKLYLPEILNKFLNLPAARYL
ncbi:MAG: YkgJ family cysteine cluster protein [Cloacibacillus sp.]